MNLWNNFIALFLTAAPWLLLGYFVAAILNVLIPQRWLSKHLGDSRPWTTIKAALIGAPLPLCSCGVIPAALGLRRAGASKNATMSFLIATPETGVDSIAVSYALLGPVMAIVRPIAAVFSAIMAGLLVGKDNASPAAAAAVQNEHTSSCCGTQPQTTATSSCCSHHEPAHCCSSSPAAPSTRISHKIKHLIRFALTEMVADTYQWLLVGLIFAAAVATWLPEQWLTHWGHGLPAMLIMALIGIPMYICATASTPVAAGFLLAGISPGAVLVFLLAGPATNVATLALVKKELGPRSLYAYLGGVMGGAIICGSVLDWLLSYNQWHINATAVSTEALIHNVPVIICGIILAIAMGYALIKDLRAPHSHTH